MRAFSDAHEEVVGLDVPVEEVAGVDVLDSFYHHVEEHEDRFLVEFPVADREKVLEGGAEQVHHHDVVLALREAVVGLRDAEIGQLDVALGREAQLDLLSWLACDGDTVGVWPRRRAAGASC